MMNVIIAEGLFDRDYVEQYTLGFEELKGRASEFPPERVEAITGIPADGRAHARPRIRHHPAIGDPPGRGAGAQPRRRPGDPGDHLPARPGGCVAACGRRHGRDADLGVPDPVRPDLPARLDQARHTRDQRARSGGSAHRRAGARPAGDVAVRLQLEPGLAGALAGQDRQGPAAPGPVHGGERAVHHRHRPLRRPDPAGDHAGRAVRPDGHLGPSLHDAQHAGDPGTRRVHSQRRAVPPAGQDHGLYRRLLGHDRRRDAARVLRLGSTATAGHHARPAQGEGLDAAERRRTRRARPARRGRLQDAVGQVRVQVEPGRGRRLRRAGMALDVRGAAVGRAGGPPARLHPALRIAGVEPDTGPAVSVEHRLAQAARVLEHAVRQRGAEEAAPGCADRVPAPGSTPQPARSTRATWCGCSTSAAPSRARPSSART